MREKFYHPKTIERRAYELLQRYQKRVGRILTPPIDVEFIAEHILELRFLWVPIPKEDNETVLAQLEPTERQICFNEHERYLFDTTTGLYYTVTGHEIAHWELNVDQGALNPKQGRLVTEGGSFKIKRSFETRVDWCEKNAHRFAGCLLLPRDLLLKEISDHKHMGWYELYALRDLFRVTMKTLTIRLSELGILYVSPEGDIYSSRGEYHGQTAFNF